MDIPHLLVQLLVAILCAVIANILVPRRVPGKFPGLVLIGLAGVWLGEQGFALLNSQYGLDHVALHWNIQDVPVLPAIIGSAIILYVVTAFLSWGRYSS